MYRRCIIGKLGGEAEHSEGVNLLDIQASHLLLEASHKTRNCRMIIGRSGPCDRGLRGSCLSQDSGWTCSIMYSYMMIYIGANQRGSSDSLLGLQLFKILIGWPWGTTISRYRPALTLIFRYHLAFLQREWGKWKRRDAWLNTCTCLRHRARDESLFSCVCWLRFRFQTRLSSPHHPLCRLLLPKSNYAAQSSHSAGGRNR